MDGNRRAWSIAAAMCVTWAVASVASAQSACVDGRVLVSGAYCCWPGQSADADGACVGSPACPAGMSASGSECVATARPSACAEGRVAVSGGYCCWPGQWVTAEGRCSGPPRCPGGLVASGAECIAALSSPAPAVYGDSYGSARDDPNLGPNQVRLGLLSGGIALFLGGYAFSAIMGTYGGMQGSLTSYGSALPSWPFAWIPFLHPLMPLGSSGTWTPVSGIVGAASTAMEIAGLVMAIIGQIGSAPEPSVGHLSFRLGAPDADGGVSGVLSF